MNNNILIGAVSSVVFVTVVVGSYFIFTIYSNRKLPENIATNIVSEITGENLSVVREMWEYEKSTQSVLQFEIKNATEEYVKLRNNFHTLNKEIAQNTGTNIFNKYTPIYDQALKIALDENFPDKERAYSLNIVNLLYIQGFDHDSIYTSIKKYPSISGTYSKSLSSLSAYKKLSGGQNGVMFNVGSVEKNYAMHKTMESLNDLSYDLEPNIYAALRGSLNFNQANLLLYSNYDLGTKFTSYDDFVKSRFYNGYIAKYETRIENLKKAGKFYTDLAASSYEADIMYTEFLIIKYRALSNEKNEEKKELLKQVITFSDETIQMSNLYNGYGFLFYGYFWSAINKVRVANFNLLSVEENDKLVADAVTTLETLIRTNKSVQMDYWVKSMPAGGTPYKALLQLSERSNIIKAYLQQVRG